MTKILLTATAFIACNLTANIAAADETIGDWAFGETPTLQTAYTSPNNGTATGMICLKETRECQAYLNPGDDTLCKGNYSFSFFINSRAGAMLLTGKCISFYGTKVLAINESQAMQAAFESGGKLGIAIPIPDGGFLKFKFSTEGASEALKRISGNLGKTPQKKTGDKKVFM